LTYEINNEYIKYQSMGLFHSNKPQTKKPKVLIVEDDEAFIQAYFTQLTKENIDVEVAIDGEQALQKAKTSSPDLILLDLIIPVKDGFLVLAELKANPITKDIPVIIVSNIDQEASLQKGLTLGAKDYIVKTNISINALVAKIRKYLPPTD